MTSVNQIEEEIEETPEIKKEPARIITLDGEEYRLNNVLHREDGPALIRQARLFSGGTIEEWYLFGRRHRIDGPAYVSPIGKQWWINGMTHRIDGPASIEYAMEDVKKPDNEKTIIKQIYCIKGKIHRWDGPAVIYPLTGKEEWWIDGKRMDRLKDVLAQNCIEGPFTEWTEGEWMVLRFALTEDLLAAQKQ